MPAYLTSVDETTETPRRSTVAAGDSLEPDSSLVSDLNKLTVAELKDLADENEVDLGDASKKDEIVAVLADMGVSPDEAD